jgi:GMP synthase (glutamine-hydrolysing)
MPQNAIAILDYGSQTAQLIARRVRELNVYSELIDWDFPAAQVARLAPAGIILSGGPNSVYDDGAPPLPPWVLESGLPVLGICYGMQLLARSLGGAVERSDRREYGHANVKVIDRSPLFRGLSGELQAWMSHADRVTRLPLSHKVLAVTHSSTAAIGDDERRLYGVQFHPEVRHTPCGLDLLANFVLGICGCRPAWTPESFIATSVASIRDLVGEGHVICGLSGGVDSAVAAALIQRAIGDRLTCVFVDHGLLREGEAAQVISTFRDGLGMRLLAVDAASAFLSDLSGVTDPEEKRRRIGARFVRTFEEAKAAAVGDASGGETFLAQGTLYPDVIESASRASERTAHTIKTHHNVGGLPDDMQFRLVEPLRLLFKDEARRVGESLGLPADIVWRHPFPGPGLAIRIIGEVTAPRLETLRRVDAIFLEELRAAGLYGQTSQAFAVLLPVRSVGVMGDGRTYADAVALRAVTTDDFMTADWARLPAELIAHVSGRIVNEVAGVNRVVYDVTSKPPATIEWE